MPIVSQHANERTRERCGAKKKKQVNKLAAMAFRNGLKHAETVGSLNNYMSFLYFRNKRATNIRIWHKKVYVFSAQYVLITVLNLPEKYIEETENLLKLKHGSNYTRKSIHNILERK